MSRSVAFRILFLCSVIALLTSCSRDPNVRKQKYLDSGDKYFAEAKYREAAIQYSNAIQNDPNFAQAHYQLSQTYIKLGDMQRAFQELSRTVELSPDNYRAHTDLANLLVTVRNPDGSPNADAMRQAKTHLDILKEKQPNSPETLEALANYDSAEGNLPAAIQEMQQAINLDPSRSESYLQMAFFQLSSNLTDQAEQNFKKAVQVDPKAMNAQLALGGFYQSHNRLPEAEQMYRHAIDLDPKDVAPRAALVRLFMLERKANEAEAFLIQTKKDLSDNPKAYVMLGDFYYASGNLDKALAEYASLYSDHPRELLVKRNYIQLLILKNHLDDADKLNSEILKSNPHDTDALVDKGIIQLHRNDTSGAVDTLQAALHTDPNNAVAHYQLGLAYAAQFDHSRAESEWREAVRIRPDLIDAQQALARIEISRGEIDSVLQTAQQIIATQPYSADGYILKGIADLARLKFADAQSDAEAALQRAPDSPTPYVELANIQLAQKHFSDAEKFYQAALDKNPSSSEALSGLMNTYVIEKEFDKAIAAANTQIAKKPTSDFYDLLGTALFNGKKDYSGAETALRKAIDLDHNNIDALEKLGKVEVQQGSLDKALALYEQATKDVPHQARFFILAGELYAAQQNWDKAKAMYQQALAISPDDPLASNNLAYVMLEQGGNIDVAMSMAQTARRGMPDNPNAADTLGWAYYQKGIYQSAISQFQEAIRLLEKNGAPDDAILHYHLGLAYQKANQLSLARQQLEKAVKLSPNNADARKALQELRS